MQSKLLKSILLLCLLCLAHSAMCANVKITGELIGTEGVTQVAVFLPIGGYPNDDVQTLLPVVNNKITINLAVTTAVYLKIQVGTQRIVLLVEPGDNIAFKFYDTFNRYTAYKFTGSNAAGQYWYNVYNYQPLENFAGHGDLISAMETESTDKVLKKLGQFFGRQLQPLDSLSKLGQIDKKFWLLATTDVRAMHARHLIRKLQQLQEEDKNENFNEKYKRFENALTRFSGPENIENIRTYSGGAFIENCYESKLSQIKPSKVNLYKLGPYDGYQLAPDSIKKFIIGQVLLLQQTLNVNEFDFNPAFKQYQKDFPNSAYNGIINSLVHPSVNPVKPGDIVLDTLLTYNSLDQVRQHFKGKAIYIDLWATWCIPCRAEFPYYASIKGVMKQKGIQPVFISIDEPSAKKKWGDIIYQNSLMGNHILAGKNLKMDISNIVYKKAAFSIPRYIIINKAGRVVSWDAPRPSNKDLVKVLSAL